jgi:ADP-ribose pyrophosphatase
MKWKVLSSERLFHDLWFKVRKERCETPEGKIIDPYYVYDFPNWVTAVAFTEDGRIVMEQQYRHALGEIGMEIPGGCVDDTDVSFEDAIKRELLEETGYAFSSYEYLGRISANPSTNSNMMHMFLAQGGKKISEQHLDPGEEIRVSLHTVEEVKEMLRKNEIIQAMHVSCIMYAFQKKGISL